MRVRVDRALFTLSEGLALGSRIGQLIYPASQRFRKWIMATLFTVSKLLQTSYDICSLVL